MRGRNIICGGRGTERTNNSLKFDYYLVVYFTAVYFDMHRFVVSLAGRLITKCMWPQRLLPEMKLLHTSPGVTALLLTHGTVGTRNMLPSVSSDQLTLCVPDKRNELKGNTVSATARRSGSEGMNES